MLLSRVTRFLTSGFSMNHLPPGPSLFYSLTPVEKIAASVAVINVSLGKDVTIGVVWQRHCFAMTDSHTILKSHDYVFLQRRSLTYRSSKKSESLIPVSRCTLRFRTKWLWYTKFVKFYVKNFILLEQNFSSRRLIYGPSSNASK